MSPCRSPTRLNLIAPNSTHPPSPWKNHQVAPDYKSKPQWNVNIPSRHRAAGIDAVHQSQQARGSFSAPVAGEKTPAGAGVFSQPSKTEAGGYGLSVLKPFAQVKGQDLKQKNRPIYSSAASWRNEKDRLAAHNYSPALDDRTKTMSPTKLKSVMPALDVNIPPQSRIFSPNKIEMIKPRQL